MIKVFLTVLLLLSSLSVYANNLDKELEHIEVLIAKHEWDKSKIELKKLDESDVSVNLLWSFWYSGKTNPSISNKKSIEYLEKAYSQGSRKAQLLLMGVYLFTGDPIEVNYSKGVALASDLAIYYQEVIDKGRDSDGQIHRLLGQLYMYGAGVKKDLKLALKYIRKAAEMGDEEAIEKLKVGNP